MSHLSNLWERARAWLEDHIPELGDWDQEDDE